MKTTADSTTIVRNAYLLSSLLLSSATFVAPLTAEPPAAVHAQHGGDLIISAERTQDNIDRIHKLAKFFGEQQAKETERYIDALGPLLQTKQRELVQAGDSTEHPAHRTANDAIGSAYYDRLYFFEQMGTIDPDGPWHAYAKTHAPVWMSFIEGSGGTLPGRWSFGEGLALYFLRTKEPRALKALELLVNHGHYTRDNFPDNSTWALSASPIRSREVAYGLKTQIAMDALRKANNATRQRSPRIDTLADFALGHLDQWFNPEATWLVPHEDGQLLGSDVRYVRPFMVALTVQALLNYAEAYRDLKQPAVQKRIEKILPAVRNALQAIWKSSWNEQALAFAYTDRELPADNKDYDSLGQEPQPDLNMLLAPLYFKVAQLDPKAEVDGLSFTECSDRILEGTVRGVSEWSWGQKKQFNQQFFHDTIQYLQQRSARLPD